MPDEPPTLAICPADEAHRPEAERLARELSLPLLPLAPTAAPAGRLLLVVADGRLELRTSGRRSPGGVAADFLGERLREVSGPGAGRRRALARAAGLAAGERPTVLDATAGLGRDAFRLASLGCPVTVVERSPVVAALLADGLRRAAADSRAAATVARMTLVAGDAREVLRRGPAPDVVLVDPMYPPARKSAAPGKELLLLRRLLGADDDAGELLAAARRVARRVVVKRRAHDPPLDGQTPDLSWPGRSTRFDVYLSPHPGN
jgi:16S rRNA (guanine1516-N2)-methyltransferase